MRDYAQETERRVRFLRTLLESAHGKGFIFGNSGGKDSALVGILCKMACDNTVGVILPCQSRRNYDEDTRDALEVAQKYGIETQTVDITAAKQALLAALTPGFGTLEGLAAANINPRLRMTALYAAGQSQGLLVAGTGNRSERYMGYFTKWGDGAFDLNPISDLTVTEIYEFLRYLDAPDCVIQKAPSAALFDGQTDEQEMGLTYADLDHYLLTGEADPAVREKIEAAHAKTAHKRRSPAAIALADD